MKPFSQRAISTTQQTSTGIGDVKTFTAPARTGGVWITVETTAARVTFDGTTPTNGNGILIPAAASPVFFAVQSGATIKAAGSGASSIINLAFFS